MLTVKNTVMVALLLIFFPSISALANTKVNLRAGQSVDHCTFDRTVSQGFRAGKNTVVGRFGVNCSDYAQPYRLVTSLSPLASFKFDERKMKVKWYIKKNGQACDGNSLMPGAVLLHSGSRDGRLIGETGVQNWFYCLKLESANGEGLKDDEIWPLYGNLSITAVDAKKGEWLPEGASVISIPFSHNDSLLSEGGKSLLRNVLNNVGGPSKIHVQIHAHASEVGNADYNHDLSLMRLKRVREWLTTEGGMKRRDTWGQAWGEDRPYAIKTKEDEDAQNRRVDVVFLPKDEADVPVVDVKSAPKLMEP